MDRYVAFLRGVNLGAKRRTGGAELRHAFEGMGFEGVATFRNSGNVVFADADGASEAEVVARIEAGLGEAFGFEVRVVLRSQAELPAIAAHEPFEPRRLAATEGRLQVLLLAGRPSAAVRKQVLAMAGDEDLLATKGRELYWLPRGRMSDSALDLSSVEGQLGLATMRTMGTIEGIVAKYFG